MEKTFEIINDKIQQINERHAQTTNPLNIVTALANSASKIGTDAVAQVNALEDQTQKLQILAQCVQDLVALNRNAIEQVKTVGLQRAFQVQVLNELNASLAQINSEQHSAEEEEIGDAQEEDLLPENDEEVEPEQEPQSL